MVLALLQLSREQNYLAVTVAGTTLVLAKE